MPLEEEGDVPMEEMEEEMIPENMSGDESFDSSDESYFSESSSDNGLRSDTDAESASGNRVTPEMVVWLMLKEQGLIPEERYVRKPEICPHNIRSLIPTIPRSYSWDSVHSKSVSGSENLDTEEEDEVEMPLELSLTEKVQNDTVEALNSEMHKVKETVEEAGVKETVEEAGVKENGCDVYDGNIVLSENVEKQTDEDILMVKQETVSDGIPKIENVEEADIQENGCDSNIVMPENTKKQTDEDVLCDVNLEESNEILQEQSLIPTEQNNEEIVETEQNGFSEKEQNTVKGIAPFNVSANGHDAVLEYISKTVHEKWNEDSKMTTKKIENISNENDSEGKKIGNGIEEYSNMEDTDNGRQDAELMGTRNSKEESKIGELKSEKDMDNSKQYIELPETINSTEESGNLEPENETNVSGKTTKSFKDILKILVKEKRIVEETEMPISEEYGLGFVEVLKSYVDELDDDYDENRAVEQFNDDNETLKTFALFLNFYSPSSYKYVTETFNTPLPDHKELCSWYLKDDEKPGLSGKAFNILKQKCAKKRQTCALMFCDVYLRNEGYYWYDQVDYGGGINEDHMDKAVLVYVFILVSLDEDWKMPIGYIFARYIPAESQAELVRVCLTQCYEAGADVVAVTLDTPTPAEFLGCSFQDPRKLKTTFKHPVSDREVAVWIDPCLALKSARQTLKVRDFLWDGNAESIRWNLLRRLRRLHSNNTMSFEREELLLLQTHIAKIGLTTETFSKSLATALQLGDMLLPQSFSSPEATQKYILYINYLYDILNSKTTTNLGDMSHNLKKARRYLLGIFCNEENRLSIFDEDNLNWGDKKLGYRFFIEGKSVCGLVGFLICIESYKHLYSTLVEKEQRLSHLNTHRLCKVHAEDFVKNLRAYCYIDPDDFSGSCFQYFYKKLFDILEKNPHFTDREVSLEHWPLDNRFSPAVTIKLTSGKRAYDDVYSSQYSLKKLRKTSPKDRATQLVREYSKALDVEMDISVRKSMVGYLAGWIAARFARSLRCEVCIDALCTHQKQWFHNYITLKRLKRVCLPSEELFRICWECERVLKQKGSLTKLRCLVLRRLAPTLPWKRSHHACHNIQLTRLVIAKYIPLRVKAPFSIRENKRLIKMFRMSKSMAKDKMFDDIEELMDGSMCSEESDDLN